MRKITKYILPRYVWFMIWFRQWFKNPEGIKGFAVQIMNWLMQRTMAVAQSLKKINKKLNEGIKEQKAHLVKWYMHPTVDADEWDEIRGTVKKLAFWVFVGVVAETACNFFAIESVMEGKGWFWNALRVVIAVGITGLCIYFFEKWFSVVINKPSYKETVTKKRNWTEVFLLTAICIAFEVAFYWLCKRRSIALEGANNDNTITNFVIIFGMLLPIGAGYLAYERSRYLSAYNNTRRIVKAERRIASMECTIATNNQKMEDHFKREMQNSWALLDEFKIYKVNYNLKHAMKEEITTGHFCEKYESFEKEAAQRYKKEVLSQEPLKPVLFISKAQRNGHAKELPETTGN